MLPSPASLRISAPASKSCRWTAILIRRSPGDRTRLRRPPSGASKAAPCPGLRPHAPAPSRRTPCRRRRRAASGARAMPRPWSPRKEDRAPRRKCRAARAATQKREALLSREKRQIGQEADGLAPSNRMRGRVVDQPIRPSGRSEDRRILRRVQLQAALRVPFRAQELLAPVRLGPVEIGTRRDGLRLHVLQALRAQEKRAHKDEEGDEARDRVARQADEGSAADAPEGKRPARLHRDAPHEK